MKTLAKVKEILAAPLPGYLKSVQSALVLAHKFLLPLASEEISTSRRKLQYDEKAYELLRCVDLD